MNHFRRFKGFTKGIMVGSLVSTVFVVILLYILNMTEVIIFSIPYLPDVQHMLIWVYDNLRLSLVFFVLVLGLYAYHITKLNQFLITPGIDTAKILQTETLVDIWTGLFFGIGVIWTAIGMRSALLSALGGLDPATAAEQGAFAILQRLVDGGILISLSTTIFGGIGGYLMRLYKAMKVGSQLHAFYLKLQSEDQDRFHQSLQNIEAQLITLNQRFDARVDAS